MSKFVCIKCKSIVDSGGTLCDNSCGTFYCDVCLQEYYLSDIVRPCHNPKCGMFSDDDISESGNESYSQQKN